MFRPLLVVCFLFEGLLACRNPVQATEDGGMYDAGGAIVDAITTNPGVDAQTVDASTMNPVDAASTSLHAPPTAAGVDYFSTISNELSGQALVNALHTKLAQDHVELSYDSLYTLYETTDGNRNGCDGIFDFYSSKCWTLENRCGNYSKEGDCFNREHSWPKSWWAGATGPKQHHDIISVIPTDGYVNNRRGSLPFGEVTNVFYTSTNGSAVGNCVGESVPAGNCFEPTDDLKGDFARIYFYEAVRYEGEFDCCDKPSVNKADIKAWQEDQLRIWHEQDPVDTWERERNERLYQFQKNRNPFVDFPVYVDRISDF